MLPIAYGCKSVVLLYLLSSPVDSAEQRHAVSECKNSAPLLGLLAHA